MLDLAYRLVMYVLFFIAVLSFCYMCLKPNLHYIQQRYEQIQNHDAVQKVVLKVRNFLELSIGWSNLLFTYIFIVALVTIYVFTFVGLILNGYSFLVAVLLPTLIIGTLYYILRLLGYRNRVLVSHEGITLVQELLNNYKIYNRNIYEAIEQTANSLAVEQAPLSKRMMKNLSYRLRQARNEKVVKDVLGRIFYVMDVSWAYSLSIIIEKAVLDGVDIEDSLKDIALDLDELESLKQILKDEIHEAKVMLMFITPGMIGLTFYIFIDTFGFSLSQYLSYQFGEGFIWLVFILILYLLAIGAYLYVTKPKNDF